MQRPLTSRFDEPHAMRLAFRDLLARPTVTVMPGGFSPIYARMAQEAGFECFFVAGSQVATFLLGVPDAGIIGLRDMVDHVRHVVALCSIPILVDCDTGYGNAVNVAYTTAEMVRAGAAGMQLEDQEAPKRSGTGAGRRCVSIEEATGKIRAAVAARDEFDPAFVICARCDAIGAEGTSFQDALDRCNAYASAGADFVWLNTIQTIGDVERAAREIKAPLMAAWGGPGAGPTLSEYERFGVRIALYPTIASAAGLDASWFLLNDLHARGPVAIEEYERDMRTRAWGAVDRRALMQNQRVRELEERFVPAVKQRDYQATFGHQPQRIDHSGENQA